MADCAAVPTPINYIIMILVYGDCSQLSRCASRVCLHQASRTTKRCLFTEIPSHQPSPTTAVFLRVPQEFTRPFHFSQTEPCHHALSNLPTMLQPLNSSSSSDNVYQQPPAGSTRRCYEQEVVLISAGGGLPQTPQSFHLNARSRDPW